MPLLFPFLAMLVIAVIMLFKVWCGSINKYLPFRLKNLVTKSLVLIVFIFLLVGPVDGSAGLVSQMQCSVMSRKKYYHVRKIFIFLFFLLSVLQFLFLYSGFVNSVIARLNGPNFSDNVWLLYVASHILSVAWPYLKYCWNAPQCFPACHCHPGKYYCNTFYIITPRTIVFGTPTLATFCRQCMATIHCRNVLLYSTFQF